MKINVGFAVFTDVVEFEPFMGTDMDKYMEAFNEWYYEHTEVCGVGVLKQKSTLPYKYFNTQVILDWMNEVAPSCNAHIIEANIPFGQEDKSLPGMCF